MSFVPSVIVRRWLETVLAAFSIAVIYLNTHREMMPRALDLNNDTNLTLAEWLLRGIVFGLMGILGFSALVVAFFLLYSPIYLINKLPHLIGKGGWVDQREIRFYLACFGMLCLLLTLMLWELPAGLTLFALAAGCGPVFWRFLV